MGSIFVRKYVVWQFPCASTVKVGCLAYAPPEKFGMICEVNDPKTEFASTPVCHLILPSLERANTPPPLTANTSTPLELGTAGTILISPAPDPPSGTDQIGV